MPIYQRARKAELDVVMRVLRQYHGPLAEAGVTVDVLMAFPNEDKNGDPKGPAVRAHGYPAYAVVRILGLKDRAAGRADFELTIDQLKWDELAEEERAALVDHELTHVGLKADSYGGVKRDDLDRPCLKLSRHDHQFGWFDGVVRRHGRNSIEWKQFDEFHRSAYTQLWLPGMEELGQEAA